VAETVRCAVPDWSYRTVLQPLLFALPTPFARDLSVGVMGALGRSPIGPAVIDFMGHMRAPASLGRTLMGIPFPTVVGLGGAIDPCGRATAALARFGVGFIEIGPVTLRPLSGRAVIERSAARQSILSADPPDNPGAAALARALSRARRSAVPLLVRLAVAPGSDVAAGSAECVEIMRLLAAYAAGFVTPTSGVDLRRIVEAAHGMESPRPIVAAVPLPQEAAEAFTAAGLAAGVDGLFIDGAFRTADGRCELGRPSREAALAVVSQLRQTSPAGTVIIAGGGLHEPQDALRMLEAGADLLSVDSGLIFSGPGLPKRINEAVLYAREGAVPMSREESAAAPTERSWLWSLLMGLGMLAGSVMALGIAATRVVLPYDEQFVAMSREQLAAVNEHLLAFMTHDRVTLAGTMITIGLLYSSLSWFGIRRGRHWARVTVLFSAFLGFLSFFLFLGFGYFDPFHAFVTAILFQFFLLGVHCRMGRPFGQPAPVLRDDRSWRWMQWGQLALIAESFGFIVAGLTICTVGITHVFVAEDFEFMQTTRVALVAAGPRVIPLVAHDRATFGGMLLVSGVTFLLVALWGFRRGERWLWWTVFAAGLSGYGPAIAVHYVVGYHSLWHLAPAWAGFALFLFAMAASYSHLCARETVP
jgi:dihydroorotate dehydrogenase